MRKGSKIDKYYEKVMLVLRKFLFIRCACAKCEIHMYVCMCDRFITSSPDGRMQALLLARPLLVTQQLRPSHGTSPSRDNHAEEKRKPKTSWVCSTAPKGQIIVDLLFFAIFFTSGQGKYSNSLGINLKFIILNCED